MKITRVTVIAALSLLLGACGFHLPHQENLATTLPRLNVEGDYHEDFYKYVVQKLRLAGVEVISESSSSYQKDENAPTLMIPAPHVTEEVVAVDSMAQALENNIRVSVSATLSVPGNRPMLMRNSLTRSVLNKSGFALASQTEKDTVIDETLDELAAQMVLRIGYLGRQSDPTDVAPQVTELLENEDSDYRADSPYAGMTVMEALKSQDASERASGTQVTLDELNNHRQVLDEGKAPVLPPVAPVLTHEAPADLDTGM